MRCITRQVHTKAWQIWHGLTSRTAPDVRPLPRTAPTRTTPQGPCTAGSSGSSAAAVTAGQAVRGGAVTAGPGYDGPLYEVSAVQEAAAWQAAYEAQRPTGSGSLIPNAYSVQGVVQAGPQQLPATSANHQPPGHRCQAASSTPPSHPPLTLGLMREVVINRHSTATCPVQTGMVFTSSAPLLGGQSGSCRQVCAELSSAAGQGGAAAGQMEGWAQQLLGCTQDTYVKVREGSGSCREGRKLWMVVAVSGMSC